MPVQRTAPAVPLIAHRRTSVVPWRTLAQPVTRSLLLQRCTVLSAHPSPLGEMRAGVTVAPIDGEVVSLTTTQLRASPLPARSRIRIVSLYGPSGAAAPASVSPVHVTRALVPGPEVDRTGGRTPEPLTGAAVKAQVEPPVAPSATVTLSWSPSPFGERSVSLLEYEASAGGRRSIVTPRRATWAAVAGRAEGAE